MRSARLLGLLGLLTSCYRPTILDGAFRCGVDSACPDGYVCNGAGRCIDGSGADLGGADAGPDGADAVDLGGADGGPDGGTLFSGLAGSLDLTGMTGILNCSTTTGDINLVNGTTVTPQVHGGGAGFAIIQQTNGPPVAVWYLSNVNIPAGVSVKANVDSSGAIPVFASAGNIVINGPMDWRGWGGTGGVLPLAPAGLSNMSGVDSGGKPGAGSSGGGGGGHALVGTMGTGVGGGAGGMAYGTPDLKPLHTGSGGASGGGGLGVAGAGGSGGGSIALIALGDVTLGATIDASGVAGRDSFSAPVAAGGGGGGSGGSILISGAHVTLLAGHSLIARGGAGGKGTLVNMPVGTGAAGGSGGPGRIWIGGTQLGIVNADPPAPAQGAPITVFPQ